MTEMAKLQLMKMDNKWSLTWWKHYLKKSVFSLFLGRLRFVRKREFYLHLVAN